MSEYFYWRYRLKLAGSGNLNALTPAAEIEGALLRHRDGVHACLQPWPTLGQGDLDKSLRLLLDGGDSDLLASCRRCIALDGAARAAGIQIFKGKTVPRSHLSVPDWADSAWLAKKISAGFELLKLKCGQNFRQEARRIREISERFGEAIRLRLDFNECLDIAGFREFVDLLGTSVVQVDFVEDPLPYNAANWRDLSADFPFDLAVDRAGSEATDGFGVRVVKPAWEAPANSIAGRVVFTSAMDHPLGQLFAAYEASVFQGELDDCGLLTHWLFEPDEFSECLRVDGCRLVPPDGTGLGFDERLDRLPWRSL